MNKLVLIALGYCFCLLAACTSEQSKATEAEIAREKEIVDLPELDRLNQQIIDNPNSSNTYYQRGRYYQEEGDLTAAVEDINRALRIDPDVAVYNYAKGEILFLNLKVADAEKYLKRAVELDSEFVDAYILTGRLRLYDKNFKSAMENFNQVLKINKYNAEAYFYKGFAYELARDTLRAVTSYQTAIEQNSEYYEAYVQLGVLFASVQDSKAEGYFRGAIDSRPELLEPWLHLGLYYFQRGEHQESITCFDEMIALDSTFEMAYFNKGNAYLDQYRDRKPKHFRDSILYLAHENFQRATSLNQEYEQAWLNQGVCSAFLGDFAEAEKCYRTALKIEPQFDRAARALSDLDRRRRGK